MKFRVLLIYSLAVAIALSPTINLGTSSGLQKNIDIRLEDFLLVIVCLYGVGYFLANKKTAMIRPPLFVPIIAWSAVGLFSLFVNIILGNVYWLRGFFYFAKEVEFFLIYFFVFFVVQEEKEIVRLVKIWIALGLLNTGYVLYQAVTGQRFGEYGTAAIGEWGVFPTGAFFLIMFLFLVNFYLYSRRQLAVSRLKQGLALIAISGLIIGIFGSASKTNFLGLFFGIFLTIAVYAYQKKSIKALFFGFLSIAAIAGLFVLSLDIIPAASRLLYVLKPEQLLLNYDAGRFTGAIIPQFNEAIRHPLLVAIGFGKGAILVYQESHNQYLRNLVETGMVGSLFFIFLILSIIKRARPGLSERGEGLSVGLSAGLIVSTMTMLFLSFATEPFIVVKPSEAYWFFTGIAMAAIKVADKKKI